MQAARGLEISKLVDLDYAHAHLAQLSVFDCDAAADNVASTYAEHLAAGERIAGASGVPLLATRSAPRLTPSRAPLQARST